MAVNEKPIVIRDARRRQMYRIDDAYLNGYARECGLAATAVYNSLCRHTDARQECFPSINGIASQHGVTMRTVIRAIKKLEDFNIIAVIRRKNEKTKRQMANVYVIVDQSQWKPIRVTQGQPEPSDTRAHEPGDKNDIKPGDTGAMEGITGIKDTQREGCVAQSATPSVCSNPECKNASMRGSDLCDEHEPMNSKQFVVWYRKSPSRHIRIIAEFVDELILSGHAPICRTVAQWKVWAGGATQKYAQEIAKFDDDQLGDAMRRMMAAKYITEFNLVTLKKFLINAQK